MLVLVAGNYRSSQATYHQLVGRINSDEASSPSAAAKQMAERAITCSHWSSATTWATSATATTLASSSLAINRSSASLEFSPAMFEESLLASKIVLGGTATQ